MSLPQIGKAAPALSLPDQDGNTVTLSGLKGKTVVLYFYPKAMTPGCTVQACGLRDSQAALKKLNVVVLGVSPDPVKKLQKFIEKDELNFTLLSDESHAVAESYGCWGLKKFMGREYMGILRQSFIIDAEGKLQHIMADVKTKTHHNDVMNWISENLSK
jgi:peroxiredoxin Q/BCP